MSAPHPSAAIAPGGESLGTGPRAAHTAFAVAKMGVAALVMLWGIIALWGGQANESTLVRGLWVTGAALVTLSGAAAAWMREYRISVDELRQFGLFVAIAGQVAVLVLVIRWFQVENPAFYTRLAPLILFGFLVHSLLPRGCACVGTRTDNERAVVRSALAHPSGPCPGSG